MTEETQLSDSEILHTVSKHPTVDLLRLLAESDWDPYRLTRELRIGYRICYSHLSILEKAGLIGSRRLEYCITKKGKEILSKMAQRLEMEAIITRRLA